MTNRSTRSTFTVNDPFLNADQRAVETERLAAFGSPAVDVKKAAEIVDFVDAAAEITDFVDDASEITDFLPQDTVGRIPSIPNPFRHPLQAMGWLIRFSFGIVSLVFLLAVIAAIPIVNFLALGYLLEVEGRMARTGKLRFAFPLLDLAPKIGSIVVGVWLWVFLIRLLASQAAAARLIDPGSASDLAMQWLTLVTSILVIVHICLALARGGSLGCFFRPIKNVRWLLARLREGNYWEHAEHHVTEFIAGLRLNHHFSLGFRGFAGAFAWLLIPTVLYAALQDTSKPGQVVLTLLGGTMLLLVFAWIPFLQARFAAENSLRATFELRAVRELFTRAPIAWLLGVIFIYVLSLPLYLFKIALPPQDAMWGVTLVFIVSIYPAKVLSGWVYHRAAMKQKRAWFGWRWMSRTVMLPLLGLYVFLIFFTQAIGEHGRRVLFEHHSFLLPVPF